MNHYQELDLPNTASVNDIRAAYKRVARIVHPDRQQSKTLRRVAECQMMRLNEILSTLTDPERRLLYDSSLDFIQTKAKIITRPAPITVTRLDRRIWATALCIGLGSIFLYLLDDMKRVPARRTDASFAAETNQTVSSTGVEEQLRSQIVELKHQLAIAQQHRAPLHKKSGN